jgi:hypothetical protein
MSKVFTILDGDSEYGTRKVSVMSNSDKEQLAMFAAKNHLKGLKVDETTITRTEYIPMKLFKDKHGNPIYMKKDLL